MRNTLSAKEFFETYRKMLAEVARDRARTGRERISTGSLKAAEAHHLSVPKEQLIKALVELAAALTVIACSE